MRKTLRPSIASNFKKIVVRQMETPKGRRSLALGLLGSFSVLPWDNYPDSPWGTLEVWDEVEVTGRL